MSCKTINSINTVHTPPLYEKQITHRGKFEMHLVNVDEKCSANTVNIPLKNKKKKREMRERERVKHQCTSDALAGGNKKKESKTSMHQ